MSAGLATWLVQRRGACSEDSAFLVLPSRFETFGLSALEAFSYGKPVIHFDLPTSCWMRTACAVSVPAFDISQLAVEISDLLGDPTRRASLGEAAYRLSGLYDWEVVVDKYLSFVEEVLRET